MLNDTQIKNFKPKDKIYQKADSEGLIIEITPKAKKHWRYRFRFNGKPQIIALGQYPITGLKKARERRDFYKSLLDGDINPAQYKKDKKAQDQQNMTNTFKHIFDKWIENNRKQWSDKYIKEIHKRANKHILPYIGDLAIGSIDTPKMVELLERINQMGYIETLGKIKGIASQVFSYSVATGLIKYNPTKEINSKIFKPKIVKHYATITEPKKIGQLLDNIHYYNGSYQVIQALKLAPYIFLRPNELAGLKWEYIDFENQQIKIPASAMKMKTPHIVPLVEQSSKILLEMKSLLMGSVFVFFSDKSPKTRHISPESLRGAIRNMGYSNDEFTTHGFRGMASTLLHEQGYNSDFIERQLAHQERNKIKGAYNHAEHLTERKQMMKEWADYLDSLKGDYT